MPSTESTEHHKGRSRGPGARLLTMVSVVVFMLLLASCREAVAGGIGTISEIDTPAQIVFESADSRGATPFAPQAKIAECEPETLIDFLDTNPRIAAAWADASAISVAEIATLIRSLEPAILDRPTRVTNHGYRGGVARPFQATLATGTAVLVDDAGIPRVRCACGNPLAEPRTPTPEAPDSPTTTTPSASVTTTTVTTTTVTTTTVARVADRPGDFCAVWADLEPHVTGGPSEASIESIAAYIDVMAAGFGELVLSAETTPGFPADGLDDLRAYHSDLVVAAATEGHPTAGDTDLRDRIEALLDSYCGEVDVEDDTPDLTHVDPPADATGPAGNCGSMQFFLLVAAADGVGLDYAEVSEYYLQALADILAGADPGPSFEVTDLAPAIAYEEVGCAGAQAMQQLFADAGMADLLVGTELGA